MIPLFPPSILLFVVIIVHLGTASWIRSFYLNYCRQEIKNYNNNLIFWRLSRPHQCSIVDAKENNLQNI